MRVCGSRLAQCLIIGQNMCHPWWHGCVCVWVKTCSVPYYRARYVPSMVARLCMCVGQDLLRARYVPSMVARLCVCVGQDLLSALL